LQIFLYEQDFDDPQLELAQFISHTPISVALKKGHVVIYDTCVEIVLSSQSSGDGELTVVIITDFLDFQLASLAQLFTSSLPLFPTLEELYISEYFHSRVVMYGDVGVDNWNTLWLDFLRPFDSVKSLYICKQFAFDVVRALQKLTGDKTTEVLPALKNILLEDDQPQRSVQKGIQQFVAARQLSGHPVDVSHWARTRCKEDDD
jgi:hypothetical protein